MKIIEGMKRLRVIEKRMESQKSAITEYASKLSTEMPRFRTIEEQKKEVAALVQSNNDLCSEYLRIKRSIEYTNLKVPVEILGKEYKISELLVIKRKLANMMIGTYRALNTTGAQVRLKSAPKFDDETPKVESLYDERTKLDNIRKWQDLNDAIDSRLEVINATTDLIEMD